MALILLAAAFLVGGVIWGVDQWQAYRRDDAIKAIQAAGGVLTPRSDSVASRAYFAGPEFDDAKLASIVDALILLKPRRIDFDQCPITDEGLTHVERLTDTRLIFVHATKASGAGIERLRAALPKATVLTTNPNIMASSLLAHAIYPHAINRVAYSHDGDTIVAGDGNGMLFVFDARTGSVMRRVKAHESWLFTLAFSPDGQLLATGGGDGVIRLWRTDTWRLHHELRGHADDVHGVAFSPDGRQLVSGSDDRSVRIWSLESYSLKRTFEGHVGAVTSVAFSPDSKYVASTSRDDTIRIWSVASSESALVLRDHRGDVMCVAFHPHGHQIASVAYDGRVLLWDVATGRATRTLNGHKDRIYSVAYSPDGARLATSAGDGTLRIWDALTGKPLQVISGPRDLSSVAWHPRTGEFALSSADGNVMLYNHSDTRPRLTVWTREPHPPTELIADVPAP
ncbi:MAG: WD40 repeat domain-containing protein [Pirellulales bacterium]